MGPGTSDGTWTQQAELTASDGAAGDSFGHSVAVSDTTVVVGAPNHQVGPHYNQGVSYVFSDSDGTWTQQAELTASDGAAGDMFGNSVAASGTTLVVGTPGHQVGSNEGQGAAYAFSDSDGTWTQQAELTASDGAAGDSFGYPVAVSGTTAVVGAEAHQVGSNIDQGAAYIFSDSNGTWTQQAELTASDGATTDQFGNSVAVSGTTAVVGAPYHQVGSNEGQGAAYVWQTDQITPGVTVTPSANPGTTGSITYSVTVYDPTSSGTPTGSMSVADGAGGSCDIPTLTSGTGSCAIEEGAGTYTITASYSGDSDYAPAIGQVAETVDQGETTVSLSSSSNPATPPAASGDLPPVGSPSPYSVNVTYVAEVSAVGSSTLQPTGTVNFYDNGSRLPGCTNVPLLNDIFEVSAACTAVYTSISQHPVTASYSGDPNYLISDGQLTETMYGTPFYTGLAQTANGSPPGYGGYRVWATANSSITYTAVEATWIVPIVSAPGCDTTDDDGQYKSVDWVGLGASNLVQAGTHSDIGSNGVGYYIAFWQLPDLKGKGAEVQFKHVRVCGGNSVTVEIVETSPNTFLMTFTDNTTGKEATPVTVVYPASLPVENDAEVVEENPGNSDLPQTFPVVFTGIKVSEGLPDELPGNAPTLPFFDIGPYPTTSVYSFSDKDNGSGCPPKYKICPFAEHTPSAVSPDDDAFQVADGLSIPAPPSG